jgi:hypothetical protein
MNRQKGKKPSPGPSAATAYNTPPQRAPHRMSTARICQCQAQKILPINTGAMGGGWSDRATPQRLGVVCFNRIIDYKTIR